MGYVYGDSGNKIIHTSNCRYAGMIKNKKNYFSTLEAAREAGYVQCKYCSHIRKYMNSERKELAEFCKSNGLYYEFNRKDGALDVISHTGRWKVIVNGQKHFIWLYHKNQRREKERSLVPGYHSQKIRSSTLMGYMQYIVEHDQYRIENPLYVNQMNGKGKTAKADQKRQAGKIRKWQSIRYVTEILNHMNEGILNY